MPIVHPQWGYADPWPQIAADLGAQAYWPLNDPNPSTTPNSIREVLGLVCDNTLNNVGNLSTGITVSHSSLQITNRPGGCLAIRADNGSSHSGSPVVRLGYFDPADLDVGSGTNPGAWCWFAAYNCEGINDPSHIRGSSNLFRIDHSGGAGSYGLGQASYTYEPTRAEIMMTGATVSAGAIPENGSNNPLYPHMFGNCGGPVINSSLNFVKWGNLNTEESRTYTSFSWNNYYQSNNQISFSPTGMSGVTYSGTPPAGDGWDGNYNPVLYISDVMWFPFEFDWPTFRTIYNTFRAA